MIAVVGILACACMFDDTELQGQLDDIKGRIEKLQGRIDAMNEQLTAMSYITSGNVITSVTQDSDGKYVITYLDSKNIEKTVVLATMEQMINVPVLGVELDSKNNLYYWTVTVDGKTTYLLNNGEKVPVSGYTPKVSVDAEGYWTVNGARINDANGLPIEANDGESCVFKSIERNENGDLVITQGNGSVITLPVQQAINLTLSAIINTTVVDITKPVEVAYDVTGANAQGAMVAVAEAEGVTAVIDREKKVITVTFPEEFKSGHMIALANDFAEHTVLRPVFFEKAKSDKIEIRTAEELVQFAADVNAGTGAHLMKAMLMNDIDMKDVASWTPIGNGKFIGSVSGGNKHVSTYEGAAFMGSFDGQGYSIRNLKLVADLTADQTAYGLFGILDGATVKNLTIGAPEGDSSELSFHSANGSDVGVIAGAVMSSTIENCVNYAPMHARGTGVDNVRATMGAFGGFVYADEEKGGSVLKNLVNYGSIKADGDKNTKNGATSVMAAGIAGITNGTTTITSARNYVYNCINYGEMTSSVPRTSGIIAAVNQYTTVELCKNYGDQINSNAGTRVGMITATMTFGTMLKDCENHGDAIMTGGTGAQVGGLVCLLNSNDECVINGGGNYGRIISDVPASQAGYKGTLVANFSKFTKVENVVAGGSVGTYNGGEYVMETITEDNYMDYIGKYNTANAEKITNIIFQGEVAPAPGIATAQDLVDFAAAVNTGASIEKWQDAQGDVVLLNDIDMKDVASWTPIGNGKFVGSVSGGNKHVSTYEGAAFTGVFDGKGFSIKNIKLVADLTADQTAYGLFGILDGATVRNLTIGAPEGDSSELSFHSAKGSDVGVIAGAVMSSTIENCVNYAPMHARGTGVDNVRATMGAFGGFVYADQEKGGSVLKDLINHGSIKAEGDKNTKNGATSVMAAGIAGITNGTTTISTARNLIYNCVNYGEMTSSVPRTSGIVSAVNQYTDLELCKNYGNQTNSNAGTRVGMITAIMANYTSLKDCENHGDAIMTGGTGAQVGGLVCLLNHASCTVTGGGNYGRVISDVASPQTGYKGTIIANFSNFAKVENVVAGGGLGTYNGGNYVMEAITSDNYMTYIGRYSSANAAKITNIIFNGPAEETPGISTAQDLVDFAAAVNSGASIEKWQAKDGGVNLLANIDMSSVENWIPIGNAKCVPGAVDPKIEGFAWTGKFDGNGRKISGLKMVAAGAEDGANYGLFGVLAPGALVQNFIIDSSCSLEVTSSAVTANGVLAGYVYDATVRDVTSYAPMTFKGTAGDKKFMSMALVGQVYCEKEGVVMDSCHNYGEIVAENTKNLQAGATAYHIAGLVGFANALSGAPVMITISDCSNYGNMTSATARTSGIVAACNRNVQLSNCVNHGDQLNTFPKQGGGRLGNITCLTNAGCSMTGCINYGDIVSTTGARSGGIVSLSNTAVFENCANYGEVISDDVNRGVFWGYNGSKHVWKNCVAGGKVGTYNNGTPVYDSYTEADKVKYLGVFKAGVDSVLENITYLIGTTQPGTGEGEAEFNILFIGNSFTKDAVEHLPGLLKAAGLDKIQLTHMYYGGRLVSEYYAGWSTSADYKCYECGPGATSWTETTGKTLKQVAESRSWDIITIQEHTGNAAAWVWNTAAQNNLQGLVNSAKATQTGAMPKFYYIMSQAYFNMGKIGSGSQPSMTWTDQAGMWEVIASFGKKVMENVSFDGIISTGAMLQNLRTSPLDNEMNLTRDGYHMDNGISRYGAACTVFETLITPKYGIKLDNNSYRYAVENTSTSAYCTPVTDANAPVALKAARYAIANPYVVTDMSDVKEDLPGNSIGDVEYEEGSKE